MTVAHAAHVSLGTARTPRALLVGAAGLGVAAGLLGSGWRVSCLIGPTVAIPAVAIGWWDCRDRRIPNVVVLASCLATLVVAALVELVDHRSVGLGVLAGATVAGIPMLVVHLFTPGTLGFGDVKYAAAVGGALGVLDWRLAAATVLVGTALGPMVSVFVPAWRRSMPLGFLLGAAAIGSVALAGAMR